MADLISSPPYSPVDSQLADKGNYEVQSGWRNFFNQAYNLLLGLTMSGTTANRPTKLLWTGRPYFDTSLAAGVGMPIWWSGTRWQDATGAPV